jgi:hypothetical protein
MTRYRVTFFKNLLSSDGHRFKCPQGTIEINCARSADRAVQAAQHRFERLRHMPEWKLQADYLELEVDDKNADRSQVAKSADERPATGPLDMTWPVLFV